MGKYNEMTTGLVWFSILAVIALWPLTNAQESAATNGSNISMGEDEYQEYDAEEYHTVQPNELNSPDLFEQIKKELASAAKQAYQDEMEKQTKCKRMEGDGRFYDPSTSSCKACEGYCLNSEYCGMQCEAYFVKIKADAERNKLKLEVNERILMSMIGIGSSVTIVVFVLIGFLVSFYRKLTRLRIKNNKRFQDHPTVLSKLESNSDHDKDDPASSASTIAESNHSNESETAKLFKNSSRDQSHRFVGTNTNAA